MPPIDELLKEPDERDKKQMEAAKKMTKTPKLVID
jgi:hypothetical protein